MTKQAVSQKYDFAFSRDCIMYMDFEGKERMFTEVFKALKPGGRAVFVDFCKTSGEETEEFKVYLTRKIVARSSQLISIIAFLCSRLIPISSRNLKIRTKNKIDKVCILWYVIHYFSEITLDQTPISDK